MWTSTLEAGEEDVVEHVASFCKHTRTHADTLKEYNTPLLLGF